MGKVLLGTIAYTVIVFPLALGWHIGLFKDLYEAFGYFEGEPNIPVGLATVVIQGFALSLLYPRFEIDQPQGRAFKFAALTGLFFWTSHVLALVAKQNVPNASGFIAMETAYLAVQFGLFAVALELINRQSK
ncbi:MAG: hypothetical protein JXR13_07420 [Thalassovita sp.]